MKNKIKIQLLWVFLMVTPLIAQDKLKTNLIDNSKLKISLNAYSFTKPLLNYAKNRGNGENRMTLFEFMDWAAENGFEAVDLTAYFFPGYPTIPSDSYINEIKNHAITLGLDISGTGVRNDFANPNPTNRASDVKHVKEWIDVAAKLGAPVIRVFSGPIPEGYENKRDEILNYMAASLRECAEYGKLRGVLIGVQNHGDFLSTADQCIELVKKVDTEGFGIINDTGYFMTEDPYLDIEKVMPYTVNFQLKESVFGAKSNVKIDLKRIWSIVQNSSYRGYIPIETLSPIGGNKKKKEKNSISSEEDAKKINNNSNDNSISKSKRPEYNPYHVVPLFFKKVKASREEVFGM